MSVSVNFSNLNIQTDQFGGIMDNIKNKYDPQKEILKIYAMLLFNNNISDFSSLNKLLDFSSLEEIDLNILK